MGLFEEQPLLLVPLILVVCGAYDLAKLLVRRLLAQRADTATRRG